MSGLATFEIKEYKRVDVVTVSGRIDSSNASEFDEVLKRLLDNGRNRIVLDMAGVNYMSSAGLRTMVNALRASKKGNGDIRLATPSTRIGEVLKLAGLESIFQTFDDQVSAVGSF